MATIKGKWAMGPRVRVWGDVLFSQDVNATWYRRGTAAQIINISIFKREFDLHEDYNLQFTVSEGSSAIFNNQDDSETQYEKVPSSLLDFGDVEQEVSDVFYNWFTAGAIECTMENMLGTWEFFDDYVNFPAIATEEEIPLEVMDLDGVVYTAIKIIVTDMGDTVIKLFRPDSATWVSAMRLEF